MRKRIRILPRYLLRNGLIGTLIVLLALLSISGFINFVGQANDIGKGNFGIEDALLYTLLTLPGAAYDMFPMAVLLGGLLAYGQLARQSELVAMRAAGISNHQLLRSVGLTGVVLAIVMFVLGEWIAAPAGQWAKRHRALAKYQELQLAGEAGGWLRDGDQIIHIETLNTTDKVTGLSVFSLSEDWQLVGHAQANSAELADVGQWRLLDVIDTEFQPNQVTVLRHSEQFQETSLNPDVLSLAAVEPSNLTFLGLWNYVTYLQDNAQNARSYQIALWGRLANVVTAILMAMLALPFVFGGLRDSGLGQRMVLGIVIGAVYFLAQKTAYNLGLAYELNAILVAWLPVMLLALLLTYFLRQLRFA
ncbi:MAG: LPS export ABC transporter permease LptG [Gammaproteobacteria bacterium]|nr:LPS export ABC transporter permease LptG [Gammaproteobacteria bacterium]